MYNCKNNQLRQSLLTASFLVIFFSSIAQNTLSGKVTDETNNQTLSGATVKIIELSRSALSETDGTYNVSSLKSGTYTVEVSFVGYTSKRITDVEVASAQPATLNIVLAPANANLTTVFVSTTSARRENLTSLLAARQNAGVVSDGISADLIRKSPDRNTSDVLKRVSGTSIQDNKYVVVRGMNDRYNEALLNGIILPSSEPDRKTFAFDIFPADIVDNITIYKSASPDLPGSFAGGLVQVTTKDVPDRNFVALKATMGFNSKTINSDFITYPGSKTDWLGYDNQVRNIPQKLEKISAADYNQLRYDNPQERTKLDRLFQNNWGAYAKPSKPYNNSFVLTGGFNQKLSADNNYPKLGGVFSLTYSSAFNYSEQNRLDLGNPDDSSSINYNFLDSQYVQNILASALANISLRVNANNKFFFNNLLSINSFDQTVIRGGSYQAVDRPFIHAYSYYFVSNRLYNGQIGGEHVIGKAKIKINWSTYYTDLFRNEPDYRFFSYKKSQETDPYVSVLASGGTLATTESGLHFYGSVGDYTTGGNLDITMPFKLLSFSQRLKFGGGYSSDFRKRDIQYFNTNQPDRYSEENLKYLYQPIDSIFAPGNFQVKRGFYFNEPFEKEQLSYHGTVTNNISYIMLDNKFTKKLRLVWGARLELYENTLNGFRLDNAEPVRTTIKKSDFLPSANFIYNLVKNANLRASYSRTVVRPLFRELSTSSFYDFFLNITYYGNAYLAPTYIDNYEVRWEHFFDNSQYYSVSGFYKKLKHSIEPTVFNQSAESLSVIYNNTSDAKTKGIELEARKDFGFISRALQNFFIYANASFLSSKVSAADIADSKDSTRPLFGQSPFLINASLQYAEPETGIGISLLFNQAGTRLWAVSGIYDNVIWEKPRPIFDAKLSKSFSKNRGIVEFSWGDILHKDAIFFNDLNFNKKYNKDDDLVTIRRKFGYTMSLSVGYRF